ncbi:hypothetical protein [Companilactobacillus kedongensis]|uniref:hypothetical protein n=1 Tax=Companilactobacillus kedongensis TaxID=2486004 RepID=UPI000F768429|nr:hypothetical protein [Companilactobacillus kedongensis]
MSIILSTVSIIIGLVVIGFIIMWITGFFTKKETVSKVGRIGFIISIAIFLAFSIGTSISLYKEVMAEQTVEQEN